MNEDFGFGGGTEVVETTTNTEEKTNLETGNVEVDGKTNIDGNGGSETKTTETKGGDNTETSSTGGQEESTLNEGDSIELDGVTYTVNQNGDLVNEKGEVFKTKAEVADFLKEYTTEDANEIPEINIGDIQKLVGVDVVDENGKVVTFDSTPEGVAQYVNSVLELKKAEFAQAGINKLIEDYPVVNDFLNYYIANGNSYEGFGEMKDRSGIQIDDTNEAQQIAIVREAWKEFGKRGNVESYIKYLKDTGTLVEVAKDDLAALQQADADLREENSRVALQAQQEYEAQVVAYWKDVKSCIDKREIAGYKIPDVIILDRGGKQVSATPDDFFNYIYQVDDNGMSQYQKELSKEAPADRMNDELLKAYLKYTGKSYNSLLEMAVANKEVKKLRLTANKNKSAKATIKITKAAKTNGNLDGENFGY